MRQDIDGAGVVAQIADGDERRVVMMASRSLQLAL